MKTTFLLSIAILFSCTLSPLIAQKVACVGDSITFGSGINNPAINSYPAQLGQQLARLDARWEVRNFGVSGATLLRRGDRPYIAQSAFNQALSWQPDRVVIKLGTNDSKAHNWVHSGDYVRDYLYLIDRFANLASQPQIWICKPVPAYRFNFGIRDEVIHDEIIPFIDDIAIQREVKVIDLYTPLSGLPHYFPDGIHPNAAGAGVMAEVIKPILSEIRAKTEFTGDGISNFKDYAQLVQVYQTDPLDPNTPIIEDTLDLAPVPDGDGSITWLDINAFMRYWLSTPNLLARWPLNEMEGAVARDTLGRNPASIRGDALWQPDGGVHCGALELNGTNSYLETKPLLNPADGPFTVTLWTQGGHPGEVLLSQSSSRDWIGLHPVSGDLQTDITDGGRGTSTLTSEFIPVEDQWYEIRLVWDGAFRYLLVDGIEVAADTKPLASLKSSNRRLQFGTGKKRSPDSFWTGLIDDIQIYAEALLPE